MHSFQWFKGATMARNASLIVLAGVLGASPVLAQGSDPTYPITSFLDWTGSPSCDAADSNPFRTGPAMCGAADQSVGQYDFMEGIAGAAGRAAARYSDHYDPRNFLDPNDGMQKLAAESQVVYDSTLHMRPQAPYDQAGDAGHPAYMPDWNHNGVFGDAGSGQADGDFDYDIDQIPGWAYFRYPCAMEDGRVLYETLIQGCVPADTPEADYKIGLAQEVKIVNARGLILDGTLWIPSSAYSGGPYSTAARYDQLPQGLSAKLPGGFLPVQLPGVVFHDGVASRQEHYYWFAMRMAREGFVVLTYDPAGQGESEGTAFDLFGNGGGGFFGDGDRTCEFGGACRDAQDAVRWFVGRKIKGQPYSGVPRIAPLKNPHYTDNSSDKGDNVRNPALPIIDTSHIAIAGNSMGALSTLAYLNHLGEAGKKGADGKRLPPLRAAVALSGAAPTHAVVPLQLQTSDYDGSPLLIGPTVFGVNLGGQGQGIGYELMKKMYDDLVQESASSPMSLIVLEGGVHTDAAAVPFVTRTKWSISLASDYAADWLNCYVLPENSNKKTPACGNAVSKRDHLSHALASEETAVTPTQPNPHFGPSYCITVPDEFTLNQPPPDIVAAAIGEHVCNCSGTVGGEQCTTQPTVISVVP